MNHNINLLASETALLIFRCLVLELWNQIIQKTDTKKKSFHLWVLIWWVFFSCSFFFHLLLLPVSGLFFFFCEQFVFVEVKHERLPKFHCNLHFFYNYCWCEVASWLFFFCFFLSTCIYASGKWLRKFAVCYLDFNAILGWHVLSAACESREC